MSMLEWAIMSTLENTIGLPVHKKSVTSFTDEIPILSYMTAPMSRLRSGIEVPT